MTQKNEVLAHHLTNLARSSEELRQQTERFKLANDRLEAFLRRTTTVLGPTGFVQWP